MHPQAVLQTLTSQGLTLQPRAGKLHVEPRALITDEARALIVTHRDALLAHFAAPRLPPCPGDVAERVAVLVHEGVYLPDAEATALGEYGFASWQAMAEAGAAAITAELDRLPAPSSRDGEKLLKITRAWLASSWHVQAVRHGWSQTELFGVHVLAPMRRNEGWGLVPQLAWSPHAGAKLQSLHAVFAVITYSAGTRTSFGRFRAAYDEAVPWWQSPALVSREAA